MCEKQKILCVDDEWINLDLFKLAFEADYEIFVADSPILGLKLIEEHDIKVVITDFKMPDMNGLEFIQAIKEKFSDRICIIITAFVEAKLSSNPDIDKLVFDYILKPWDYDEVKSIIDKALLSIK